MAEQKQTENEPLPDADAPREEIPVDRLSEAEKAEFKADKTWKLVESQQSGYIGDVDYYTRKARRLQAKTLSRFIGYTLDKIEPCDGTYGLGGPGWVSFVLSHPSHGTSKLLFAEWGALDFCYFNGKAAQYPDACAIKNLIVSDVFVMQDGSFVIKASAPDGRMQVFKTTQQRDNKKLERKAIDLFYEVDPRAELWT